MRSVDGQFRPYTAMLHHVILEPPAPERRKSVGSFEIGTLDGEDATEGETKAVIVRYDTMTRLIWYFNPLPWIDVDVVKHERDVMIAVWVALFERHEPNVFHCASVKRSVVTLMNKENLEFASCYIRSKPFKEGGSVCLSVSIRDKQYNHATLC